MPGQIRLRFERRLRKDVAVHVRLEHMPDGMQSMVEQLDPAHLAIIGPESHVRAIEQVETDPVDVRTLPPGGQGRALAYLSDPRVNFDGEPNVVVRIKLVPIPKQ
jgi:hypothetical protein